jgi:hypothetical protein
MWSHLAGSALEAMIESRQGAEQYLSHSDPRLRFTALSVIRDVWGQTVEFESQCIQMALHDPDSQVQGVAVTSLSAMPAATNNLAVRRVLATIVRDTSRGVDVRLLAYNSLYTLSGVPLDCTPLWRHGKHAFRFPEDINWKLIDDIANSNEKTNTE